MRTNATIAAIAIIAGVTAFLVYQKNNQRDEGALLVSGNVEVTEVNIGFNIPGRVTALLAEEGQKMKKGDKLAVLERAELESIMRQSKAMLSAVEAELEKARKDYDRAAVLIRDGAISAQQMDAAKRTFDVAESQLLRARAALAASRDRLRETVIYAPVSGVILRKNVEPGETVAAGTAVYSLGDLDNPWIKVYVKEDKLGLVKLGQKAEIAIDSFPGKSYESTVTFISSEAEFTPKNVQTQEERVKLVFGVKVSVKNQNDELKPGMPADVKILLR